tara:strand:- start:99246 stop:100172 length:927 start_codon:yes stop_codon:yes gene_type:complete
MKLGLGTVQFGRDYGVSNATGQVADAEVRAILARAQAAGIAVLDTAAGYGAAETVLGRTATDWPDQSIVTKTCVLRDMGAGMDPARAVQETFAGSLKRLGRPSVYALMAHLADELLSSDGDAMWAAMASIKAGGGAQKIGASCYTPDEAQALLDRYPIEILQLPMNIFDQRMVASGMLDACYAKGVEVHVRSAFLQGLILMDPDALPDGFASAQASLRALRRAANEAGVSPLALALRFVLNQPAVARVIVGVTSVRELNEILAAADTECAVDFAALAVDQISLITPSMWPPDSDEAWAFRYEIAEQGA